MPYIGSCLSKTRCLKTEKQTGMKFSKFNEKEIYLKQKIPFHKITICKGLGQLQAQFAHNIGCGLGEKKANQKKKKTSTTIVGKAV